MSYRKSLLLFVIILALAGCEPGQLSPSAGTPAQLSAIAGWKGADPNSPEAFRFVVMSDRTGGHAEGQWAAAVSQINLLKPDFVMCVGDLIEGYSEDADQVMAEWDELDAMTNKLDAPFFYCPGNHDATNQMMTDIYVKRHGVKGKPYYSFDYRGCHFVVLNLSPTVRDLGFIDEQFDWLERDMAAAADAEHVFLFYHEPLWNNPRHWKRVRDVVPVGKTTIFTGHWHELNFDALDGVPSYVLGPTGARTDESRGSGRFRMFAHVAVDGGKPTISFLPLHQILPGSFAVAPSKVSAMMGELTGLDALPARGGSLHLTQRNPLDAPMTVSVTWKGENWSVAPPSGTFDVAPGETAGKSFELRPTGPVNGPPEAVVTYLVRVAGMLEPVEARQTVAPTVYREVTAARLTGADIDGDPTEWAGVIPERIAGAWSVRRGVDDWAGPADCSFDLRLATDGDRLLVSVAVTDDNLKARTSDSWQSDAISLSWNALREGEDRTQAEGKTGHLSIPLPGEGQTQPALKWYIGDRSAPDASAAAIKRTPSGYVCELAIPLETLGIDRPIDPGLTVRLNIEVNDVDPSPGGASVSVLTTDAAARRGQGSAGYIRCRFE